MDVMGWVEKVMGWVLENRPMAIYVPLPLSHIATTNVIANDTANNSLPRFHHVDKERHQKHILIIPLLYWFFSVLLSFY